MIFRTLFPKLIHSRPRRVSPVLNLRILSDVGAYALSYDADSFLEGKRVFMVSQSPPDTFFEYLLLFFFLPKRKGAGWDRYSMFFQVQADVLELSLRRYREAPERSWKIPGVASKGEGDGEVWCFPLALFPSRTLEIETEAGGLCVRWELLDLSDSGLCGQSSQSQK